MGSNPSLCYLLEKMMIELIDRIDAVKKYTTVALIELELIRARQLLRILHNSANWEDKARVEKLIEEMEYVVKHGCLPEGGKDGCNS